MRPSDIHSPAEQARSSPWAIWTTPEDNPRIPSHISLGDPSTFWWKDVEEKVPKTCTSDDEESVDSVEDSKSISDSQPVAVQRRSPPAGEPGSNGRPPKRYRADSPSEEEDDDPYFYDPKCDSCKRHNLVCGTLRSGYACTGCRIRKLRCSARGESRVFKRSDGSMVNPVEKKPRVIEKSKPIVGLLHSQGATRASEGETAPTMTERKEMRPIAPSKRRRGIFS
ncbi:hypothetical protein HD554DRAFT_321315 [Boletus coccyginus]|nr:hypothetical protein HD554DRAFT_321315 [Boletus coccyginus]